MKRFLILTFICMVVAALAALFPRATQAAGAPTNVLFGVAAVSQDDAWTVGEFMDNNGNDQALAEHWNGSTWQVATTPPLGSGFSILNGVTAISGDIWAVG